MSRIQELQERATKAEQLAKNMLDALTIERLLAFASECRAQISTLTLEAETRAMSRNLHGALTIR
jgi:hypothetical protein